MALVGYLVTIVIVFVIARGLYNREIFKKCSSSRVDARSASFQSLRKEIWKYAWPFLAWAGTGYLVDKFGWNAGFYFWICGAIFAAIMVLFVWNHKEQKIKDE
jgi:uncharacterized membrane protein